MQILGSDMGCLSNKENQLLIDIIHKCYQYHISNEQFEEQLDRLKTIIPFEYWSLVYIYFDVDKTHFLEISWFKGIPGFDEAYIKGRLFYIDPISLTALEMAKKRKVNVQFWAETYGKYPESDFYQYILQYDIANYNGYTHLYLPDVIQGVGFSVTGPSIKPEKDPKYVKVLELMLPHIAHVAVNGKIGKFASLTERQFECLQLKRKNLPMKQIARIMEISESGVEKHLSAVRKKIGASNNKELQFAYSKP